MSDAALTRGQTVSRSTLGIGIETAIGDLKLVAPPTFVPT